jgi:pimeloyl-ACP methyl ester carboxylesterase
MPISGELYYAASGERASGFPPLILIHGAGSSHLCWAPEIRCLKGFRVLAVDLPGHGRSAGIALQSIAAYTKSLEAFLESCGFYRVVLIGHSMGGAIALQAALNNPARICAIGVCGTSAHFEIPQDLLSDFQNPASTRRTLETLQNLLFTADANPKIVERSISLLKQTRRGVLHGDLLACSMFDLRSSLSGINIPAWIVSGSQDQLAPLASARFLASHLPQAELQVIPGTGHMAMLEAPADFQKGLLRLLKKVALRLETTSDEQLQTF